MFEYGLSEMPTLIENAYQQDWLVLTLEKKEVILSHFPDKHGFFMIIPVILEMPEVEFENLFIVLEQIRYTMLDEQTYINLKVISLIMKQIMERKFYWDKIMEKRDVPAVIYNFSQAQKIIPQRIKFLKEVKVDYSFFQLDLSGLSSQTRRKYLVFLEEVLRVFDAKFWVNKDTLVVFLMFSTLISKVLDRLTEKGIIRERIKILTEDEVVNFLIRDN